MWHVLCKHFKFSLVSHKQYSHNSKDYRHCPFNFLYPTKYRAHKYYRFYTHVSNEDTVDAQMTRHIPMSNKVFDFKAVGERLCRFIKALLHDRQQTRSQLLVMLFHGLTQLYTVNNLAITRPSNNHTTLDHSGSWLGLGVGLTRSHVD